jgi:hypothetical protein
VEVMLASTFMANLRLDNLVASQEAQSAGGNVPSIATFASPNTKPRQQVVLTGLHTTPDVACSDLNT